MNLLTLQNIKQSFGGKSGKDVVILEDVDLTLHEREIVSLLGKSGSGKSTLLRIIAGLITPTEGKIFFQGQEVTEPIAGISMIFQTFALFPWLTIQENIEIALKAKSLPKHEITEIATKVIEIIGLSGHESAYPRELSGGMRQRVGFARALAVNPQILLMDEPFSALDILTAKTLRTDFLDLWLDKSISLNSVLIVTHNIEEAVLLSDRIKIFSSNPGRIIAEVKVNLKHPRDRLDPAFNKIVEEIYELMTSKLSDKSGKTAGALEKKEQFLFVKFTEIINFIELLCSEPYKGTADIPEFALKLNLEITELLPVIEGLQLLRFAESNKDIIKITAAGRILAEGNSKVKKQVFGEHLIQYLPFIGYMRRTLHSSPYHGIEREIFLNKLEEECTPEEAENILKSLTNCARYAGLFSYNDDLKLFYIKQKS